MEKRKKKDKTSLAFRVPQRRYIGKIKMVVINEHKAEEYKTYLELLGYNKKSVRIRYHRIREFLIYLQTEGITELSEVKQKDITAYYGYIQTRENKTYGGILSQKTTAGIMWVVKQFFTMLQSSGYIEINPASEVKYIKPKNDTSRLILTQKEIAELREKAETREEKAILALAYGCGLRASEISQLNIEDVKLSSMVLIVKKGKGSKRRVVPLSPGVKRDLSDYYFNQRCYYTKQTQAFLLNSKNKRMKIYTCNSRLKEVLNRCSHKIKAKNISLHNLRHSIATHLLEQGLSLEKVREFLGHSQLETTEVYTRISKEQLGELTK